jgi:protein O-GlcNAc transferase
VASTTRNVIAFSLWGSSALHWVGARRNIELARTFYPGWICRFYVDESASSEQLNSLRGDNVELFPRKRKYDWDGLFWRFSAASDPDVDIALFRDCDSRIGSREVAAVDAWLKSGKDFHIMRDHPWHTTQMPGGMWGCRGGVLSNVDDLMANWTSVDRKGCDQKFLEKWVYPLTRQRALEHSEFGLAYGNPTSPFPSRRQDYEFVGEVFDEHGRRDEDHRTVIVAALSPRAHRMARFFSRIFLRK